MQTNPEIPTDEFYRIKRLPPYVFAEVNKLKAQLRADGQDIIDFGFGNPDLPTPQHVIDKLIETVQKPRVTGYSASRGIKGLRQACSRYYDRRFGVKLDAEDQVIATMGSKEGFANLAQAITAPGDVIYAPDPSYPLHAYGFVIAAHDIILLSDLAYSEIYFGEAPPSIFEFIDPEEIMAIETISLSKTYSMAGWRMGFAVGNRRLIAALTRVKSYLDYGSFTPIQVAACAALDGPQDCIKEAREIYRKRRDVLVKSFGRVGWDIPSPDASMFAWVPLPPKLSWRLLLCTWTQMDLSARPRHA